MIDSELKLYNAPIMAFTKSVVIKNSLLAKQAKDLTLKLLGIEITSDKENPYYIQLCGEYSILDAPIYINEGDQKFLLSQALLQQKPWIRKKYQIYGTPFANLCEENPGRAGFLRYIINPPFNKFNTFDENLEGVIAAPDMSLLSYDASILEVQEKYSLIEALNQFVDIFRERWLIKEYHYEEFFGLGVMGLFYALLPTFLLGKRIDNIKTQYANSFHIWNHLIAYGLEDYRTVLTIDQQLFLYKNIEYIIQNIGKHGTLAILAEKILRQNFLSIEPKMLVLDYPDNRNTEKLPVTPLIVSRTFDDVPISRYFDGDTTSIEQFYYNLYVGGFITKNDYTRADEVHNKFSFTQQTTLQTKFLELKRDLPHHPHLNLIYGMMIGGLIHFLFMDKIKYNIPVTVDKLDFSENIPPKTALLLMLFYLQKEQGVEDPKIPALLKAYPFIRNTDTFVDEKIKTVEGVKNITDFISVADFRARYQSVDVASEFNFNTDPMTVILNYAQLILEDLMLASDGDLGINQAINKLHNQLFRRVDNNQIALFDLGGSSIQDWLKDNYYSLYELNIKIALDDTITFNSIVEQIIEGFIPSISLSEDNFGIRLENDDKYNKLKALFVQLCSYNVVFTDLNIKNQSLIHHSPVMGQITELQALKGLSDVKILSYETIQHPSPFISNGQEDPLFTGFFVISGKVNDPEDELIEYKLELSRFPDFSIIDYSISGTGDMTKGFLGITTNDIPTGKNLWARVRFRSDLLIWRYSDPSSGVSFNTGMIEPPVIHFPEITEYVDQTIVIKPALSVEDNKINGRITSSPFKTAIIQVEGFSIALTASQMKLTYNHHDLHLQSRWYISKNEAMTDLVYDSGWCDDLLTHRVPWDKNNTDDLYFAVKFKGLRFGESTFSNISSFDMRALKKPSITDIDGSFDPLLTSILTLYGDEFAIIGDYPDVHDASRWTIAIDPAMTKVIYDSGWVKTALEELETPLISNTWAESFDINKPILITSTDRESGLYEFSSSPFEVIPRVGIETPANVYVTVQYRGKYFGESEVSNVFPYACSFAPRGSIKVTIKPDAAVVAGAKWRKRNTETWRESGDVAEFLSVGVYGIEFNEVSGYYENDSVLLTVVDDQITEYEVTYVKEVIKGSLQVIIQPEEAAAAGGWWRRKDTVKWNTSGFIETDLTPGTYEIEIQELSNYSNRASLFVEVLSNQMATATYTYELIDTSGAIDVEASVKSDVVLSGSKHTPPANVTITIVGGGNSVIPTTLTVPYGSILTYQFLGSYKRSADPSKNKIITTVNLVESSTSHIKTGMLFNDASITFNHEWFYIEAEEIKIGSSVIDAHNRKKTHSYVNEENNNITGIDSIISGSKRTPVKPYTVTQPDDQLLSSEGIIGGSKTKVIVGKPAEDNLVSIGDLIVGGSKRVRSQAVNPAIMNDGDGSYPSSENILYGIKRNYLKPIEIQIDNKDYTSSSEEILAGSKRTP